MNQFTKSSDYNLSFPDGEENYIRTIFEKQSRMYARYVTGEEEIYTPFRLSGKG